MNSDSSSPDAPSPDDRSKAAPERSADEIGRSRELALLVACHLESYPQSEQVEALEIAFANALASNGLPDSASARIAELGKDPAVRRVARRRLDALVESLSEVDSTIESVSNKWRLDRMHHIERNLIRLAVVELRSEVTPAAVLNAESVRLANRYGAENSSRFVNGIVDALINHLRD